MLAALLGALFCLAVSASRLYLQVHYPPDILAGLALGSGWVLGVEAIYRHETRDMQKRTVLLTLPRNLVDGYRRDARARNVSDDAVVSEILAAHYGGPGRELVPTSRSSPPR